MVIVTDLTSDEMMAMTTRGRSAFGVAAIEAFIDDPYAPTFGVKFHVDNDEAAIEVASNTTPVTYTGAMRIVKFEAVR